MEKLCAWIYDNLFLRVKRLRPQKVKGDLAAVSVGGRIEDAEREYYTGKIKTFLLVLAAGAALSLLSAVQAGREREETLGSVARGTPGEGTRGMVLIAESTAGEVLGEVDVAVGERTYTRDEADELFYEASALLPGIVLNGNRSAERVTSDLSFPSSVSGYPFRLSYSSSLYGRVGTDGRVSTEDLSEEGEDVTVTVTYDYADWTWEQEIPFHITAEAPSGEESFEAALMEAIALEEEESRFEEEMPLPASVGDMPVIWKEAHSDHTLMLILFTAVLAVSLYIASDARLLRRRKEKEEEMRLQYPQFVSKLLLYLRAGLPLRAILKKIADGGEGALETELKRVTYETDNGLSEITALERFAARVKMTEYTRLVTLLSQNMTKGSSGLLPLLREEAAEAVTNRLNHARTLGEQASTKLMLPMMLLLAVVMVLIMVPAYLSF